MVEDLAARLAVVDLWRPYGLAMLLVATLRETSDDSGEEYRRCMCLDVRRRRCRGAEKDRNGIASHRPPNASKTRARFGCRSTPDGADATACHFRAI